MNLYLSLLKNEYSINLTPEQIDESVKFFHGRINLLQNKFQAFDIYLGVKNIIHTATMIACKSKYDFILDADIGVIRNNISLKKIYMSGLKCMAIKYALGIIIDTCFILFVDEKADTIIMEEFQTIRSIPNQKENHIIYNVELTQLHGRNAMVMPFFVGSLKDLILDGNKKVAGPFLDEEHVFDIFVQISHAIDHLRTCKILHCDVKPANIFISNDNQVYLADFGSAVKDGSARKAYTKVYLKNADYDSSPTRYDDLWALLVTCLELRGADAGMTSEYYLLRINQLKHEKLKMCLAQVYRGDNNILEI